MSRSLIRTILSVLLFGTLLSVSSAFAQVDGSLIFTQRAPEAAQGQFGRAGSLVEFSSRQAEQARIEVQVEVNGILLEASQDLAQGVITWTGYGQTLFRADREALMAFAQQLTGAMPKNQASPAHEDLLHRLVLYWSEAPAGLVLNERQVVRPARIITDAEDRPIFGPEEGTVGTKLQQKACYVADDDGIRYIGCSHAKRTFCHDQNGGGHCFACASLWSGNDGSECLGECGPGCNGLNIFTVDCGDHDRCCRVHGGCLNPWDGECGDEYFDADDDFLWGWPNC